MTPIARTLPCLLIFGIIGIKSIGVKRTIFWIGYPLRLFFACIIGITLLMDGDGKDAKEFATIFKRVVKGGPFSAD